MKIIAPSILSADFGCLKDEIAAVEAAGADWIHVDVMDGHFVPNITMGPVIVKAAKQAASRPLDVHLMIERPDDYIPDFIRAGADLIAVHAEACIHLSRTVQLIKEANVKAGVALNPSTPLSAIDWIVETIDFVVVMSVNPGFGGQRFIPNSVDKIKALKTLIDHKNPSALIEVDGGINRETVKAASLAGADAFVAGSAVFNSPDYKQTIESLRLNMGG